MELTFLPLLPTWAIVLVALGLLALLLHGSVVLAGKRVPRRWIGYLAALRLLAVGLFVLCLLRPVASYTRMAEQRPAMLVMLDTSASMAPPQAQAPAPGTSGTPGTPESPGRLAQLRGRMEESGLNAALEERFEVRYYAFDQGIRPLAASDLAGLTADGRHTLLAESLAAAGRLHRAEHGPEGSAGQPLRVLLVSDGLHQDPQDPAATARAWGMAVHPLAVPAAETLPGPPAVTIAGLYHPQRVLLGSEARFGATLRQQGAADLPLRLELLEDGQAVLTQPLRFHPGEAERQVQLAYRPAAVGPHRYTLQIRPDPETEGGGTPPPLTGRLGGGEASETSGDEPLGNHPKSEGLVATEPASVSVQVVSRQKNVLMLEDTWRWSFKFLRRLFEDDPSFAFTAFVARGPGIYMQFAEPDRTVKLAGFPQSRAELEWFDLVVLGDVSPQRWPAGLLPGLHELVVREGKSLVVVAGPHLGQWTQYPLLASLLPVELDETSGRPVPGPLALQPTAEAYSSPLFYAPASGGHAVDWTAQPAMDQIYVPLRKKPAATILLEAPRHRNAFGSAVVAAEHTVGKGRVLFLGTDTLWKWQMLGQADAQEQTLYQVFWRQALRALAPDSWAEGEVGFALRPDRTRYQAGQTVTLRGELDGTAAAEAGGPGGPGGPGAEVQASVRLPDGRELPLMLLPPPGAQGAYTGQFEAAQPGPYRIAAQVRIGGRTAAEVATTVEAAPAAAEDPRAAPDQAALARLAAATGGAVVDPARPDTWPAPAADELRPAAQARLVDLWQSFTLLLAMVAVLGLDWLLRLLRGFV